jgi:hypothetical protein
LYVLHHLGLSYGTLVWISQIANKDMLSVRHLTTTGTRAENTFVKMVYVEHATGEHETNLVKQELGELNLQGIGLAAGLDGASTNFGKNKGMVNRLGIEGIHCGGHKSNLSVIHVTKAQERTMDFLDHLKGIATDLWSSAKRKPQLVHMQVIMGQVTYKFLYSPITRWIYIKSVCQRYILILCPLAAACESRAVSDSDSIALGRLKKIRNVRHIHLAHIMVDVLGPVAKFNKKFQSNDALVCEFGSSVKNVVDSLTTMKNSAEGGPMEESFYLNFDEKNKSFKCGEHKITVAWNIGTKTRAQVNEELELKSNLLQILKKDRDELYSLFIAEWKKYYPKREWDVFDLYKIPDNNSKYGEKEIVLLYERLSNEVPVLACSEGKLLSCKRNLFQRILN